MCTYSKYSVRCTYGVFTGTQFGYDTEDVTAGSARAHFTTVMTSEP